MRTVNWFTSAVISTIAWLLSRLIFLISAYVLQLYDRMVILNGFEKFPEWIFGAYARFDHGHFQRIALGGYFQLDRGNIAYDEAFFPGFPYATRGLAWLMAGEIAEPYITIAMTLISWIGTLIAGTLLIHLARTDRLYGVSWFVMAIVFYFGPYSLFYMASYAEGPFVAFAIGSWELARQKRWGWAALLAAFASALRANGLFLIPMLAVMILAGRWKSFSGWRDLSWLVLPALPPTLYFTYLWSVTGNFFTWFKTQEHWGRVTTLPWHCLRTSFNEALIPSSYQFQYIMELVAWALFVLVIVELFFWRQWEWFWFTLITLSSLTTSLYLLSVPRSMLSCFPVLVVMAYWLTKAPWWLRWIGYAVMWSILALNVSTILVNAWTG